MAKRKQFSLEIREHHDEGGREIERLFEAQQSTAQRPIVRDLPVDRIRANPFQARTTFEDIDELAHSIRVHGFISRLRVRPHPMEPDQFQLVYGERRLRAAIAAGLATVPCEIAAHSDEALLEIGLAENIQRQELNPVEEAQAFKRFIEERGYSQLRLADRIGRNVNYVNRRLKLLEIPADVQEMLVQRPDTIVVAREIARLATPDERRPLIEQVVKGDLSTRDVHRIVHQDSSSRGSETINAPPLEVPPKSAGFQWHPGDGHEGPASAAPNGTPLSLERDMRTVRRIFVAWNRNVSQLDDQHYNRLLAFIEEHLQEVQRLMASLEEH